MDGKAKSPSGTSSKCRMMNKKTSVQNSNFHPTNACRTFKPTNHQPRPIKHNTTFLRTLVSALLFEKIWTWNTLVTKSSVAISSLTLFNFHVRRNGGRSMSKVILLVLRVVIGLPGYFLRVKERGMWRAAALLGEAEARCSLSVTTQRTRVVLCFLCLTNWDVVFIRSVAHRVAYENVQRICLLTGQDGMLLMKKIHWARAVGVLLATRCQGY